MNIQKLAKVFGIVFVLIGVLGFVGAFMPLSGNKFLVVSVCAKTWQHRPNRSNIMTSLFKKFTVRFGTKIIFPKRLPKKNIPFYYSTGKMVQITFKKSFMPVGEAY